MAEKNNKALKAVSYMMMITLVGKIFGLLREILLANSYGVGMEANAFLTASRIPRTFFDAVFASAISSSFIPIFNEYLEKHGKKKAYEFSDNFITLIFIGTFILTCIGSYFSSELTVFFADGYDSATIELCTRILVILFPTVIITGVAYAFVGILQSMGEFSIPAALSIVSNGVIIIYFLSLNGKFGIIGLSVAFLIGWAMQIVIQLPSLNKMGYKYKPYLNIKDSGIKKVFALMLPIMISTWVQPINILVNGKFASRLYEGAGYSAIEYANNIYTIITGVFVLSVANVIFPEISRLATNKDEKNFAKVIDSTIGVMFFLLIPMTVGLASLSYAIVSLAYMRGAFNVFSAEITSEALFFFSFGMIGFGIQTILTRAFYAVKDGKTPLIAGALSILVNLLLNVALVDKMQISGLALGASISSIIYALVLLVFMRDKIRFYKSKKFISNFFKIIINAGAMWTAVEIVKYVLTKYLYNLQYSTIQKLIYVLLPTIVGAIIYMFLSYIMSVKESREFFGYIKNLIKRKKVEE